MRELSDAIQDGIDAGFAEANQRLKVDDSPPGIPAKMVALQVCADRSHASPWYTIGGLSITIKDGRYEVAATDCRRMAILSGPISKSVATDNE